ncbi:PREDICTED: protein phosphatase 2C 7-like isoform X1 [Ipomoea nil]|uniref:protein phosphatase 2C 7-like isoform X1 n=2 Tax=Ipomoea nil TaxID=35883 RepID=UPI000900D9AB|nr:PREDICTED: protein phosphatase 2C 7-like isoform X1 [Ipomoea nil]XP_019193257.1 PREDICTED: protein phosphatase 2C 7-like isoform X1 [Ipomoea nil]XP_019193258.1 PREDICTED: protein phosphatase 2C 7-like isoform X1 [Ipomoea nil]
MEEMSPAVAVTLSLSNTIVDSPVMSNHVEITRLKLVTDAASLLAEPASLLHADSNSSWDGVKVDVSIGSLFASGEVGGSDLSESVLKLGKDLTFSDAMIQENEYDEILSVGEEPNEINGASDISLPIAVEIEGIDNGQIVAKVISLEERSFERKVINNLSSLAACSNEGIIPPGPTIKASVVALPLPSEKDPVKGGVKSVFELDCVPLWGSVSICGKRPEMEDSVMAAPHFMKIPIKMFVGDRVLDGLGQTLSHLTSHFFGVYDGHGGSQVANYCRERIHLALAEELEMPKDDSISNNTTDTRLLLWEKVFRSCFLKVDDEVGGKVERGGPGDDVCTSDPIAPETVGSTAVVAVISSSHIVVANCGDSRAVLYRGKEAMALSIDHKPNREDEYARIEASGGRVIQWNGHRVFGVLAMSRSIGDRYLKPWIIPEPEVMFIPRAREDECLVLASDGLWDVMTNEEACEAARKKILIWHKKNGSNHFDRGTGVDPAAQAAAEYLSMLALQKGSRDNISIIVVDLKAQRKFKTKS